MMTLNDALMYEVHSSWWAPYIRNKRLQNWAGRYFARKASRKFTAYQVSVNQSLKVRAELNRLSDIVTQIERKTETK